MMLHNYVDYRRIYHPNIDPNLGSDIFKLLKKIDKQAKRGKRVVHFDYTEIQNKLSIIFS